MGGEWENNSEDIAKAMITDYIKKSPYQFLRSQSDRRVRNNTDRQSTDTPLAAIRTSFYKATVQACLVRLIWILMGYVAGPNFKYRCEGRGERAQGV